MSATALGKSSVCYTTYHASRVHLVGTTKTKITQNVPDDVFLLYTLGQWPSEQQSIDRV
mgnify:CR=1 FL=1